MQLPQAKEPQIRGGGRGGGTDQCIAISAPQYALFLHSLSEAEEEAVKVCPAVRDQVIERTMSKNVQYKPK